MKIGIITVKLRLHYPNSLKEKRAIIKSLITKIRNEFNVSIAEVDHLNDKRSAKIGAALISNDGRLNHRLLSKLVEVMNRHQGVSIEDYQIEIL